MKNGEEAAMRVTGLAIALVIGGAVPALSQVCTLPKKGLKTTDKVVEAQTLPFSERGQSFALEVYSSYAPQIPALGAPWCLLYEAENSGSSQIGLFNWPLGGMQADPLVPHDRQSRWVTRTSANRPSVNDTVIFAFKSTALRSRAYQAFMPEPQLRLAQLKRDNATAGSLPTTMAQVEPNQFYLELRIVKEPVKFPQIGGDFSGSKTALSVGSQGDFDGKTYRFLVSIILSGDPVQNITQE
jgi:hypothetical protein